MAFLKSTTTLLSKFLASSSSSSPSPFRSASARAFRSTAASSTRDGADDGPTTKNADEEDHYDNVADFASFFHGLSPEAQAANVYHCERFEWNPFLVAGKSGAFHWKKDEEGGTLCFRIDVPGVASGDVEVELEEDLVRFRAQEKGRRGPGARKYSGYLPFGGKYRIDQAKVSVKYGVLKITIPK
ncbi:hypothetical protein Tsubulata_041972 [Turnera subulata]|uniref:SHSP domain-containing protein n=1 Tax=Turnera subulata TaxID=218843 RepID=A0A9Q0FVP3_9ROSI|nr:hypothetical protein Tsubulata_041972 [Turnera subulata]